MFILIAVTVAVITVLALLAWLTWGFMNEPTSLDSKTVFDYKEDEPGNPNGTSWIDKN